jgi:hypothetical protein
VGRKNKTVCFGEENRWKAASWLCVGESKKKGVAPSLVFGLCCYQAYVHVVDVALKFCYLVRALS